MSNNLSEIFEDDNTSKQAPKSAKSSFEDVFNLWRDPPEEVDEDFKLLSTNEVNDILFGEIVTEDMSDLRNMLLGHSNLDEDSGTLSLAHEKLIGIPNAICHELGSFVQTLDITGNCIRNLDFLEHFTHLTTLIADENPINSIDTNVPWLPKLELLYLNQCCIGDLYWIESLKYNCPKLKYLSLMGNPVVPSFGTKANIYEHLQYRLYVISALPNLQHLDDKKVTDEERIDAKKMYPIPFFSRLFNVTRERIHHLSHSTGLSGMINREKNCIV